MESPWILCSFNSKTKMGKHSQILTHAENEDGHYSNWNLQLVTRYFWVTKAVSCVNLYFFCIIDSSVPCLFRVLVFLSVDLVWLALCMQYSCSFIASIGSCRNGTWPLGVSICSNKILVSFGAIGTGFLCA